MLNDSQACPESDYWALGVTIFQLLYGRYPFEGSHEGVTFDQIINCKFEFPDEATAEAKDLINKFLKVEASERLTDYQTIMEHPFFENIDFDRVDDWNNPVLQTHFKGE